MIEVLRAPAYATVQDAGREGFRSGGVPKGGAMDALSLSAGNALLGNEPGAAAIEWALTGGALRFRDGTSFALTGATADALLNDTPAPHNRVLHAGPGDVLEIRRVAAGRFLYVCFRGGVDVPVVLGGRGTYLPGAFGGVEGRSLQRGDVLAISAEPAGKPVTAELPPGLRVLDMGGPLGLMRGPEADLLPISHWRALSKQDLVVSPHSDRIGYRLTGLERVHRADPPRSGPSCPGAVQLTPAGELIVLMADGPTVGGYPKIGVVAAGHLPRLAQTAVGGSVRFRLIEPGEAVSLLAAQRAALQQQRKLTNSPATP